jgi:arsenate reductase
MTAHWGSIEDPATIEGTDIEKKTAFTTALRYLKNRIATFTALPINRLDHVALQAEVRSIGQLEVSTPSLP